MSISCDQFFLILQMPTVYIIFLWHIHLFSFFGSNFFAAPFILGFSFSFAFWFIFIPYNYNNSNYLIILGCQFLICWLASTTTKVIQFANLRPDEKINQNELSLTNCSEVRFSFGYVKRKVRKSWIKSTIPTNYFYWLLQKKNFF